MRGRLVADRARESKLERLLIAKQVPTFAEGASPQGLRLMVGWWLVVPYALLAVPTVVSLAQQDWSREFGAYGPIVLATGLWLLWRASPDMRAHARSGSGWITWPIL